MTREQFNKLVDADIRRLIARATVTDMHEAALRATAPAPVHPDILAALQECAYYFENRADVVDGPYGAPEANRELQLLAEVRAALKLAGG